MSRFTAQDLRRFPTPTEKKLWLYLRARKLDNHRFRRQHQIGKYIVDFACLRKRLIIELDGPIHEKNQTYDFYRDLWLKKKGFLVLRIKNDEAENNIQSVLLKIKLALKIRTNKF